jgi:hypothetical protein
MAGGDLTLPDGLELTPIGPEWLTSLWPMKELDSSIGSIILTLGIYAGLLVAALILMYLTKTFMPKVLNKLFPFAFVLASIGILASAYFSFATWNQPKGISDHAMGIQATKVLNWASAQNVNMDNANAWRLLCHQYDHKNTYCNPKDSPSVYYQAKPVQVHLEKKSNGTYELYDFKNKTPLIK